MKNILAEYMRNRMEKKTSLLVQEALGPVVTISREYGCPGKIIAQDLCIRLNQLRARANKRPNWRWISKEILEESRKALKMDKHFIKEAVNAYEEGVMDDIILSLSSKFYPGSDKVKKTLAEVIKGFARQGNVIIVGRGGVTLTRDIKNALHIRLQAPLEWRIQIVSERKNMPFDEARKLIMLIDLKRKKLVEYFNCKKLNDCRFDLHFNYMTMEENEILDIIIRLMEMRNMI